MSYTTYSFSDHVTTINPPAGTYPPLSTNGQGLGDVNVSYMNDNTTHELAADGNVMITKIKANNAHITITMQQTSALNQSLRGLFNALNASGSNLWAGTTIRIINRLNNSTGITCTGVSFQKRADMPFQQQGQMVTWNFMAADVQALGSIVSNLGVPASVALGVQASILNI